MSDNLPPYIFLFGVAGVGKTYSGEAVSQRLGLVSYDLDQDMTPAMRAAIAQGQPFTDEIRDEFFEVVCQRITDLKAKHPQCIFMQGAYRQKHRDRVTHTHPDVVFVLVDAPEELTLQRLHGRGNKVSREYAATLRSSFEAPPSGTPVLVNDTCTRDELVERFTAIFNLS
jgi:gluconokinase